MGASRGTLVLGDAYGALHLVDSQLKMNKFQAYEHFVSHVKMLQQINFMVTVGDGIDPRDSKTIKAAKKLAKQSRKENGSSSSDEYAPAGDVASSTALVKVWRTDQLDWDGRPKMVQEIGIFKKYPEEAVTAFAVCMDLTQVAVGLKNGAIILFRSELKKKNDQYPPILLQPAAQYPVTGLWFTELHDGSRRIVLYACTKRGLTSYPCSRTVVSAQQSTLPEHASLHRPHVLDERGVDFHCSAVNTELNADIAIAQSDGVYFFTPDDRSVCFGFEGEKKYCYFFKHYLMVAHVDPRGRHQVNIYDLQNKFIAFNWTLTYGHVSRSKREPSDVEEVRHAVSEFGSLFVVSSKGLVYRITEKDTASKLDILFRKNLYSIAISLAYSANYDPENIVELFRMYGDHLYDKHDFDGAVRQYSRTIGHVEPSYVIRRFLDAQRMKHLTTYLEALHEKSAATSEHTTLLLNCYTKLKDVKKLDQFIRGGLRPTSTPETALAAAAAATPTIISSSSVSGEVMSTIQQKLKSAAASSSSWSISNVFGKKKNESATNISSSGTNNLTTMANPLDNESHDNNNSSQSKQQLNNLTFDVETAIRVLQSNYPQQALALAEKHKEHHWYLKIQLDHISYVSDEELLKPQDRARLEDALAYITKLEFAEAEANLRKYGRTLVTHLPESTTEVLKALCTGRYAPLGMPAESSSSGTSQKSDAAEFIHLYVAHPKFLRTFLEYIVEADQAAMSPQIGNTLLELILQEDTVESTPESSSTSSVNRRSTTSSESTTADSVMRLLTNPKVKYDQDHALILCQILDVPQAIKYLYEKLHMHHMLMEQFMQANASESVMDEVRKHGHQDANMCLLALQYFADHRGDAKKQSQDHHELEEILDFLETHHQHIIPPLQVIQVLSETKHPLPLSVIRRYVVKALQTDAERVTEDQEEIDKYRQDTARLKKDMANMTSKATVFQATKCDLCQDTLDHPSAHFLCGHSFHASCLEGESDCSTCATEHRHLLGLQASLEHKAENHERFYHQLETSPEGFNVVAEYFSKGIFKIEQPEDFLNL